MRQLTKSELNDVVGGGYKLWVLGGIVTFIIGFIDGFTRKLKCN